MKYNTALLFAALLGGCGISQPNEDYHLKSSADLSLGRSNHPHGYGQSQCFACHVKANIHLVDKLNTGLIETAKQLVNQSGLSSCSTCHGQNGVP